MNHFLILSSIYIYTFEIFHRCRSTCITEILTLLRSSIDVEDTSRFNVTRLNPLDGACRALHRKSFNPKKKISVMFCDEIGLSEGAVDEGGPTREMFRLVIKASQSLSIFEGPLNQRRLALNSQGKEVLFL